MKIYKYLNLLILAVIILGTINCKNENQIPARGKGKISLNLMVNPTINVEHNRSIAVNIDSFKVIIYSTAGTVVKTFDYYKNIPPAVEFDTGYYYVVAHSNNLVAAAFESPYYFGQSLEFHVAMNEVVPVSIPCELDNFYITVDYSEKVKSNFKTWETTITNDETSLVYTMGEKRAGYFKVAPVTISATLNYVSNDSSRGLITVTGSIVNPTRKTHYYVTIDALVDTLINSIEISVDGSANSEYITFTNYQPGNPDMGLAAFYPFNGNANDHSGNKNDGIVYGATPASDRFGNSNSAYLFDGIDDFIEIPWSSSLNFNRQISVSFWAKLNSFSDYYYPHHIIEKFGSWSIGQRENDVEWGAFNNGNLLFFLEANDFEINKFYHLVMTYDGSVANLYIDGVLNRSASCSGLMETNSNNIYISKYPPGGNYYFDGVLDDFRIYNRALTTGEIAELYEE